MFPSLEENVRSLVDRSDNIDRDVLLGLVTLVDRPCFGLSAGEFDYNVCPFRSVTQTSRTTKRKVSLGKSASSVSSSEDEKGWLRLQLTMTGGDPGGCPNRRPRQTTIDFVCSPSPDAAIDIAESEVCKYTVRIGTSAACVLS